MRILTLGIDKTALDKDSKLSQRIKEYERLVEKYTVIVPEAKYKVVGLFDIFLKAGKELKKEKYDLISVQDQYYLALLGWLLAKKFRIGLELQIHGFEKYRGLRKLVAKFVIPRANAVRAVSQRLKKQLVEEFSVREEKITMVPIYMDINTKHEARPARRQGRNSKQSDNFVFLTVGRLVPVKNIRMQIEAMDCVTRNTKRETRVELWIVGDGLEKSNLKSQISNLHLENNVKMFGYQDDVSKFYKQADAFLLTSDYEGWGMAVIEAASHGLPIIMTDVGCAGEVIKNGENGIIIPVGNKEKLVEAMLKLPGNADLREIFSYAVQEEIKKLPNKEQIFDLYKQSWQKAQLFLK